MFLAAFARRMSNLAEYSSSCKDNDMNTLAEAKAWQEAHRAECLKAYVECKEIPDFLRSSHLEEIWMAGCWLKDRLVAAGMGVEQASKVLFCCGQRSLYNDPWKVAMDYINEFEANGAIDDKPGAKLAAKLVNGEGRK